jgi:hypothetical protein
VDKNNNKYNNNNIFLKQLFAWNLIYLIMIICFYVLNLLQLEYWDIFILFFIKFQVLFIIKNEKQYGREGACYFLISKLFLDMKNSVSKIFHSFCMLFDILIYIIKKEKEQVI